MFPGVAVYKRVLEAVLRMLKARAAWKADTLQKANAKYGYDAEWSRSKRGVGVAPGL